MGSGVYQSWHQSASKRGQIPGWLVEGPKISFSWCRPSGECDVGVPELVSAQQSWVLGSLALEVLGACVGMLKGGFWSQQMAAGFWESCGWCSGGQSQVLCPLVDRAGSFGFWELRDSKGSQPAGRWSHVPTQLAA